VISHPLGRAFILEFKERTPFSLDLLPVLAAASALLRGDGFAVEQYVDEPEFYLVVTRSTKS
jgi:hypothetical protein